MRRDKRERERRRLRLARRRKTTMMRARDHDERERSSFLSFFFFSASVRLPAVNLNVLRGARSAIPLHYLTIRHCQLIRSECRRVSLYDRLAVPVLLPPARRQLITWPLLVSPTGAAPACHVKRNCPPCSFPPLVSLSLPSRSRRDRSWRRFSRWPTVQRDGWWFFSSFFCII